MKCSWEILAHPQGSGAAVRTQARAEGGWGTGSVHGQASFTASFSSPFANGLGHVACWRCVFTAFHNLQTTMVSLRPPCPHVVLHATSQGCPGLGSKDPRPSPSPTLGFIKVPLPFSHTLAVSPRPLPSLSLFIPVDTGRSGLPRAQTCTLFSLLFLTLKG